MSDHAVRCWSEYLGSVQLIFGNVQDVKYSTLLNSVNT